MHKMMVLAKAVPGKTEALAQWYDNTHIPDLLAVPGLITAERHDLVTLKSPEGTTSWDFMLIYEFDGPDPMAVLKNMAEAQVVMSDVLESSSTLSIVGVSHGVRREG